MSFHDQSYVDAYLQRHEFPAIHDEIFALDKFVIFDTVMDLGCCTGLLAARLAETHTNVVAIEPNKNYLKNAVQLPNIHYYNMGVSDKTLDQIAAIIRKHNVKAIFARRVLPEIYDTGGESLVRSLIKTCHDNGVLTFVVEGRVETSRSAHALKGIDDEINIVGEYYQPIMTNHNCLLCMAKPR